MYEIEELEKQGIYISIFAVVHKHRMEWSVGIKRNTVDKNEWLDTKDEGCQFSSFLTYSNALKAALKYCNDPRKRTRKILEVPRKNL